MCGICGISNFIGESISATLIESMNNSLIHRGPDSGSVYVKDGVALGHRRLSILDLSENGNQPMLSQSGKLAITFNGEIYNFKELKQELVSSGFVFKSSTDTEVLVNGYEKWGLDLFEKLNGMFSLAIYDSHKKELILARDRFGIKPLYFYLDKRNFIFGSEIKAILKHPEVKLEIDDQGLLEYFWYGNELGNRSIYSTIQELGAGSYLVVKNSGETKFNEYYSVNQISQIKISEVEAIDKLRFLVENAVKRQLVSDVPVGVFLSGGIDSSALTAYASRHYGGKLDTFTVAFDFMPTENEFSYARKISEKYNTNHREIFIRGGDLSGVLDSLISAHDMPFGDAADIPLYLLSQELKSSVKVVLQGDGGDELFGGYNRHKLLQRKKFILNASIPLKLFSSVKTNNSKALRVKRLIYALLNQNPAHSNALLLTIESEFPMRIFNKEFSSRYEKLNPFLRYEEVYSKYGEESSELKSLFSTDMQIILKDTFFEKVDRSTMSGSIEARVPFLDNDLVDFALSLPAELKVKNGISKYLFKESLRGEIPDSILDAGKRGFGVPYGEWLKGPLKDYFFSSIESKKIISIVDKKEVLKLYNLHCEGKGNSGFLLWKLMIFGAWIEKSKVDLKVSAHATRKKSKILCVIDNLGSGGAQRQLVLLAEGLKSRGYDVNFFTYHDSDFFRPILDKLGIKIFRYSKKFTYSIRPILEIRKLIMQHRYDVVISFLDTPNFYVEIASLGLKNIKLIVSERSQIYSFSQGIRKSILSLFYFIPDHIVCNNNSHANWISSYFPWLKNKLSVIRNGIDLSRFKGKEGSQIVRGHKCKLVGLGRITAAKNLPKLAKAFVLCRKNYNLDLNIDWFGRIDDLSIFNSVSEYLKKEGQDQFWKWGGEIEKPENVLSRDYDALISASLWEGFPNAIYEAMACGVPVLASRISDIPEIVDDGVAGLLFEPSSEENIAEVIYKFFNLPVVDRIKMSKHVFEYSRASASIEKLTNEFEKLFYDGI